MPKVLPTPSIVFEDNHFMAIDKPPGWLVQSDQTGDDDLISHFQEYLRKRDAKPGNVYLSAVHRLDRPVGGLVLMAKTSKAASRMGRQFQEQQVRKIYLGICRKRPDPEHLILVHFLQKDSAKNRVHVYDKPKGQAKRAETHVQMIGEADRKVLLLLEPRSGRPHQIRAQLSRTGLPLMGDLRYGATMETPDKSLGLHALALGFVHPVSKTWLLLRTPFPRHGFWHLMEDMKDELFPHLPQPPQA